MKTSIFRLILLFVLIFGTRQLHAQTSLAAGDIAIIWNQTNNPDSFGFVTFVDIVAGTVIYFTDCGADAAGFNTPCTEGAFQYTVPARGLNAGDIIRSDTNSSDFTDYTDTRITGGSFLLSTVGDQVIAFQDASFPGGSSNAGNNPAFIFVSSTASTTFTGDKTDSNETGLPPGLSDTSTPRTALGLGAGPGPSTEVDNVVYNGTFDFSSGGITAAKLAFSNPANYYTTDINPPGDTTYNTALANFPSSLTLTSPGTTLAAGDVAILWNQTDGTTTTDSFAFVTFVDIDAGTVIYFTDCGADAAGFNTPCDEGALAYTVPTGGLNAGDIITYSIGAANFAVYTDTRITFTDFDLSSAGDQVIVFQDASNSGGSSNAANNPRFIFASNTASTLFTGNKTDRSETGLPAGLSDTGSPRTAVGLGSGPGVRDEWDNTVYNGTYNFPSGISAAKVAITNPANYYATDTNPPGDATYNSFVSAIPAALTFNASCAATDNTPPVPDVASLPDVTVQCQVTALTPPSATDNCGGTVTVTSNASLPITAQGTTVVTWTYDDGNGNTSTQNQNIIIDDTTPPTPDVGSLADVTAQCQVIALTPPAATDNCGGTVTVTNNATLPIITQGTTVVTWTYDDGNGNTSTQNQNVVIDDTTGPTPDAGSLPDITAECSVTSLTPPAATDNCGGTVTVTNNVTLPITASGTIIWTFDDGNGNTSTQNQNVVINDVTAPVPDAASLPDLTAECEIISLTPPTATDNCGGTVTVTNNVTLPITAQGTTIVTWSFDDGNGNTSTQNQNVILNDVTDPVPDAASLPDLTAECEVIALTPPTATDNCGTVTITNDATLPINTQGTTVVTWTYDDGNGNTVTQTQNVVIDDTAPPTPDVGSLADVTAQCQVTALTPPAATDNCGGTVTVTSDAVLPINTQGTTVVTWTYDDGNGNTSTQTQNVVIDDVTAPVPNVASLPDVTAECEVTSLTPPTATDNCGGTVTVTNNATLPITTTTLVTWSYNDGNGNVAFQNQNVVIDDVTAPVPDAASLPDLTAECEIISLTPPIANDNCGGTVTVTNNVTLPITAQGTTIVTWTFDDGNGNTSTQNQNVILNDITDPVPDVASLPDVTAQCEVTALTPPTATDNCGGTVTVTSDATLPINTQGTTVVTWTYDDGNGNTVAQTQNVVIDDTTPPTPDVVPLPDVTAECEVTALTPPTATDNCGGTVTVTSDAVLPINTQGATVVTWTYDDGNGNTSTQTQNVVIDDVTAPVPDAASLPDVTSECEVTSLVVPTATDNCGGTVTVTNNVTLPITAQGTTVVAWTFDDGNGNTATQSQNVILNDVTSPVPDVASLSDITVECEVTGLTPPTATDNCGGTVTVTNDASLPIDVQGTTVVTWTYDDGNGNTVTQTQNVVINDITDPVAVCNDLEVTLDMNGMASITADQVDGGSTDNCSIASIGIDNTMFTCADVGDNIVTLTVTDINGNTDTCEATVTVVSDGMAIATNNGSICDGGDLQLSETSGIADSWLWTTDGNGVIDDPSSQNPLVTNVGDGEIFTVSITFAGGCTATASTTATVIQTPAPTGNSTQDFCQDEVFEVADIQVDTEGTVLWYATDTGGTPLSDDTVITDGTTYYAAQFNEETGCESLDRFAVTTVFINCVDFETFKKRGFSPNGDGENDTFTITELRNNYPNYTMEVYNRNGSLLFKGNANTADWDGTSSQGTALGDGIVPNGVYFYVINFGDGETEPFQGIVYLNR